MQTKTAIYSRKSPDVFSQKKVEETKIQTIVQAGNYAPVFGSVHFTVVENSELISAIKNTTIEMMKHSGNEFLEKQASNPSYNPVCNAPTIIVLSALNGNDAQGFNMANIGCAAQNMLLMSTELGVFSRYVMAPVMALSGAEIAERLAIPEGYSPLAMVLIGYADAEIAERDMEKDNVDYVR